MGFRERLFGSSGSESDGGIIDTSSDVGQPEQEREAPEMDQGPEGVIDESARTSPSVVQRARNADRSDVASAVKRGVTGAQADARRAESAAVSGARAGAGRVRSGLSNDIRRAEVLARQKLRSAARSATDPQNAKRAVKTLGGGSAASRPSGGQDDPREAVMRAGRTAEMSAPVDATLTPLGGGLANLQTFAGGAPAGQDGLEEFVTGRSQAEAMAGPSLVELAVGVGSNSGTGSPDLNGDGEPDDPLVVADPFGLTTGFGGNR